MAKKKTTKKTPAKKLSALDAAAKVLAGSKEALTTKQMIDAMAAKKIIDDAKALEDAGVFSMILEAVPAPLGRLVAEAVSVPVIGIGAGPDVDGQVLVTHDMIGLFDKFVPKFVKQYAQIRQNILEAMAQYKGDVQSAAFPGPEHSFKMPDEALEQLKKMID